MGAENTSIIVDDLLQILSHQILELDIRKNILQALSCLKASIASPQLLDLLVHHPEFSVSSDLQICTIKTIGKLGDPSLIPGLIHLPLDTQDITLQAQLANTLACLGDHSRTSNLLTWLTRNQIAPLVGADAVHTLIKEYKGSIGSRLIQLLANPQLNVLIGTTIIREMLELGSSFLKLGIEDDLIQMLKNHQLDLNIRKGSAIVLVTLEDRLPTTTLQTLLSEEAGIPLDVRYSIAESLVKRGKGSHVVSFLRSWLLNMQIVDEGVADKIHQLLWQVRRSEKKPGIA